MKKILATILIVLVLFSCKKDQNNEYEKKVTLANFSMIETYNYFKIYLVEDTVSFVRIVGDEKGVEKIDLLVENDKLMINDERKFRFLNPQNKIILYIHSKPLSKFELFDGGEVETVNPITSDDFGLILSGKGNDCRLALNTKTFYYWNNFLDGGKLYLTGQTDILKIWNYKLMSVDAKLLTAKRAIVENDSEGDCEVNVTDKLEYSISGKGDIFLNGNPGTLINTKDGESEGELIRQ